MLQPIYLILLLLLLTLAPAHADTLTGRVIGISDGDTLSLLTADRREVKIRLAEIDAPEKAQPYGTKSKQALSALAYGKQARVAVQTIDQYGRTVGRVSVGSTDVNAALVQQGAAWVYRQYAHQKKGAGIEFFCIWAWRRGWVRRNGPNLRRGCGPAWVYRLSMATELERPAV